MGHSTILLLVGFLRGFPCSVAVTVGSCFTSPSRCLRTNRAGHYLGGMDNNFRLGDNDRLHALKVLGTHFADGRLDSTEFDERTRAVAEAKIVADITPAFADLPGGLPFESGGAGQLVPVAEETLSGTGQSLTERDELAELQEIKQRGKKIENLNGVIVGVTLVAFLILQFVIGVAWAWVVWPSLALTLAIPRLYYRYGDEDEETYEELKVAENENRKARIRRATERMRELEED